VSELVRVRKSEREGNKNERERERQRDRERERGRERPKVCTADYIFVIRSSCAINPHELLSHFLDLHIVILQHLSPPLSPLLPFRPIHTVAVFLRALLQQAQHV